MAVFHSIVHATDFSEQSSPAFAHALKLALMAKCELNVLHVRDDAADIGGNGAFSCFRWILREWSLIDDSLADSNIPERLAAYGVRYNRVERAGTNVTTAVANFIRDRRADLVVLTTEGREGVPRWLKGSIAEAISREAQCATLFIPETARGFVDTQYGTICLQQILVPIDHHPSPNSVLAKVREFAGLLRQSPQIRALHVGSTPPSIPPALTEAMDLTVAVKSGAVVDTILNTAVEDLVDLIVMPTSGHSGFLDALRGSTTERTLREAPCPVLAIPVNEGWEWLARSRD